MQAFVIVVTVAVVAIFVLIIAVLRRYKRCPSDRILVVYGKVGKNKEGTGRSARCIHGGAAFIWPVIQDYEFLDLTPIPIEVDLRGALSKQNIRVNVPSRFMVGISTEPGIMDNAAERLLGQNLEQVRILAEDIIFGQLRVVIATMNIEEINNDREKFLLHISEGVEHEVQKIGLKLINVNVTDITDASGYIDALGKEAASQAINEAKKVVAEKNRDGSIGEAEAQKDQRIRVSAAFASAKIGEAEAEKNERVAVSKANSNAVEGENLAKITIANSDASRRVSEAEARKLAVTAEKTNDAQALEESYKAEKMAEESRAEKLKATQFADIIVPVEIEKQKIEISAEANAEQIRRIAKGQADATFFKMEAEAKGIFEILSKQAAGFTQIVKAANDDADKAAMLMITDKLENLVKTQVEAIKNIEIDKITVWENGGGANGGSSTANFMKNMMSAVPPLQDLFNMAGMNLPEYLKGKAIEKQDKSSNKQIEEVKIEK